jgi:hypothetical protein
MGDVRRAAVRATALRPHRCPACGRVIARLDPRWSWNRMVAVARTALESHTPMCVSLQALAAPPAG